MRKATVEAILREQPDEVDLNAFLEDVLLREKLDSGEADIAAGQTVTHDEAKERLSKWLA